MFNINNYNITLLYGVMLTVAICLLLLYRNKVTSIVDPMFYHIVWVSGNLALLVGYIDAYGVSTLSLFFITIFIAYLGLLAVFLENKDERRRRTTNLYIVYKNKSHRLFVVYIVVSLLFFVSKIDFILFAATHAPIEWVLYRFEDLQGRNPILRILEISSETFFVYFSFVFIFFIKKYRLLVFSVLLAYIAIKLVAGGRSTLLSLLFSLGFFIFFHFGDFNRRFVKKLNAVSILLFPLIIGVAILISSFFRSDATLADGFFIIANRMMASGDGLEYYMKYNGLENIDSGIGSYVLSVFGIYLKNIVDVEYKNVGWQLTELAVGTVGFAQGSNYTFPLQIMVLGYVFAPLYLIVLVVLITRLRRILSHRLYLIVLFYYISYRSMGIVGDIEYWVLTMLSGLFLYTIVLLPVLRFKVKF